MRPRHSPRGHWLRRLSSGLAKPKVAGPIHHGAPNAICQGLSLGATGGKARAICPRKPASLTRAFTRELRCGYAADNEL
jgi:hypothetical protein